MILIRILLVLSLSTCCALSGDRDLVSVHVTGNVHKPGIYQIPSKATLADLKNACGGWAKYISDNYFCRIRLKFEPNLTEKQIGLQKIEESTIKYFSKNTLVEFMSGDIIYIPEKKAVGK